MQNYYNTKRLESQAKNTRDYDTHCLFIPQEEFRKLGLGSQLLHNIIDDLRRKGIKAVETFARKSKPDNPSGPWSSG